MLIIGEKINATLRCVKPIIENRDGPGVLQFAREQAKAGANYIDVNVATGLGSQQDEVEAMSWAVETIVSELDSPICIDSADPAVLEAGLKAKGDRQALLNSAKAEKGLLEDIVGLAKRFETSLVGLAMDEKGIPPTSEGRLSACEQIAAACEAASLPAEMLYFDPLALPISTDITQGLVTLETIHQIKERFPGTKTVLGLSNISFGLPDRGRVNCAFLQMASYAGLDAAIADPMDQDLMHAVKTANVLLGRDRHCRKYMRAFRT
jgi:5-methyltetrahydrofolate corrinoid/iron sulfur protein methyltransferase